MQVLRFFRYIVYGVLGILSAYFATFYATAVAILPFEVAWNALSSYGTGVVISYCARSFSNCGRCVSIYFRYC
ncbi:hypothetical protein FJ365_01715 [Candidatus Dependentiae bacterium]|nr:hypothetical protein [Candidatus Dependentiae bacterium]